MRLSTSLKPKQNDHVELRIELTGKPFIYVDCLVSKFVQGAITTDMALTINHYGDLQLKTSPPLFTYEKFLHGSPYHVALALITKAVRDYVRTFNWSAYYYKAERKPCQVTCTNLSSGDVLIIKVSARNFILSISTQLKAFNTPKSNIIRRNFNNWNDFLVYLGDTM